MTKTRSSEEELLSTDISLEENAAKSKGTKAVKDNSEKQKDLSESIDQLLEDLSKGEKKMKVYKQMKMYNDETLNPVLYKKDE